MGSSKDCPHLEDCSRTNVLPSNPACQSFQPMKLSSVKSYNCNHFTRNHSADIFDDSTQLKFIVTVSDLVCRAAAASRDKKKFPRIDRCRQAAYYLLLLRTRQVTAKLTTKTSTVRYMNVMGSRVDLSALMADDANRLN